MVLPPHFKESQAFIVLTDIDKDGYDVGCLCGGWFRAYANQPTDRPKGWVWCKCDECGKDDWQRAERCG